MKSFSLGIIKHNCSTAMKRGKHVQVYNPRTRKRCPNCRRKWLKVKVL